MQKFFILVPKILMILALLSTLSLFNGMSSVVYAKGGFLTFEDEAKRITKVLNCNGAKIVSNKFLNARLYVCIMGKEETAKVFMNETTLYSNKVKNIKIMWNDWKRDVGNGLHSDKKVIYQTIKKLSKFYAPAQSKVLLSAFSKIPSVKVFSAPFYIYSNFTPGPKINEHLLTISLRKRRVKKNKNVFVSSNGALYGYVIEDKNGKVICKNPHAWNSFRGSKSYLVCQDSRQDNLEAVSVDIKANGVLRDYEIQDSKGKKICKNPIFFKNKNMFFKKLKGHIICG